MGTKTAHGIFLSGLLAVTSMAHAQMTPPASPAVVEGKTVQFDSSTATLVLEARGEGVQIYTCAKDADWAWKFKGPDAMLFDAEHHSIGRHFAGPKWRLEDGSEVQGKTLNSRPQAGTVPWL